MPTFTLHPDLQRDAIFVADLPLCRVLLMKNANFPWLLLVPHQNGIREIFDLSPADYDAVMREVREVTTRFAKLTGAFKMNVATLGNVTPQLHIHIIARFEGDAAWPMPVWGKSAKEYTPNELENMKEKALSCLQGLF